MQGGANPTVVEMNPTYKLKLISDPNRPSQLTVGVAKQ